MFSKNKKQQQQQKPPRVSQSAYVQQRSIPHYLNFNIEIATKADVK
jgi:hypothetical protein